MGPLAFASAFVWALPLLLAAAGFLLARGIESLGGSAGNAVHTAVFFFLGTALLSWQFLIVGGALLWGLARLGWAGLGPALIAGALLAGGFALLRGGDGVFSGVVQFFALTGAAHAGLVWIVLRRLRPGLLVVR